MQSQSAEGRILGALGRWLLPKNSQPALILRDLLDDAEETEEGEAKFVADAHSVIFAIIAGLLSLPAIALMAAAARIWSQDIARRCGAILWAPTAFFISLALALQVAKFRGRHRGAQPMLGNGSWVCVGLVVFAVALFFAAG